MNPASSDLMDQLLAAEINNLYPHQLSRLSMRDNLYKKVCECLFNSIENGYDPSIMADDEIAGELQDMTDSFEGVSEEDLLAAVARFRATFLPPGKEDND